VGDLILHASAQGVRSILLGLGGSATNDGGTGMAQVLGIRFLDQEGQEVVNLPQEMEKVRSVDFAGRCALPELVAMCDVTNPLLGPQGCTRVFGPQKGFRDFAGHEAGLKCLVDAVIRSGSSDYSESPGAGAAGGLGFGCLAFAGARLERGFAVISRLIGLEDAIRTSSLVITGEGSLDPQTLNGKGPHGVVLLAKRWGKPALTFCGICEDSGELKRDFGEIRSLKNLNLNLDECIVRARELLELRAFEASEGAFRKIAG
jgi:glycerate 2-kinase